MLALSRAAAADPAPTPPPDARPTDPCYALHSAEYISPAITTADMDVGDDAMACGRAYLAQAPDFAGWLFLEAGDAYARAAALRAHLADDAGELRDRQKREATIAWGLAWRAYNLAAQLGVKGAPERASEIIAHVPPAQ
jgi:hypothetical protein